MRPPLVREPAEFDLGGFEALVGPLARLRLLARRLHRTFHGGADQTIIWHVNSSGVGGGVADLLNSLIPLSNSLGVLAHWLVIGGDERFFHVTKAFHNALQGDAGVEISEEDLAHYRRTIATNALMLEALVGQRGWRAPDLIVLHDPQPAGLIAHWRTRFPDTLFIWQGHIHFDFQAHSASHPGRRVWEHLVEYVNQCDAAVFHLAEYVPPGLTVPVRCFLPSINPLGSLNRDLSGPAGERFIGATLAKYGMRELRDGNVPLVIQVARFDPWKDPLGVLQAYREARERLPRMAPSPHLLLVGLMAEDDPEAVRVVAQVRAALNGDRTVHLLPLSATGAHLTSEQRTALRALGIEPSTLTTLDLLDLEINAFQTRADVIVAKSLREGFGLAATGAGYHGKPRIVSEVGGLTAQVVDGRGRANAWLVGGRPFDPEAAVRMTRDGLVRLLRAPRLRRALGSRARRHVLRAFLPHRHLQDYFTLFLDIRARRLLRHGGEPKRANSRAARVPAAMKVGGDGNPRSS